MRTNKQRKSGKRGRRSRVGQRRRQRLSNLSFALHLPCMDAYADALA